LVPAKEKVLEGCDQVKLKLHFICELSVATAPAPAYTPGQKETTMSDYWSRGELTQLSEETGISPQQISDIIHRRRQVSFRRAVALQNACENLGKKIPWTHWIANQTSSHPAFCKED
jgi:hypothetical protein